MNKFFCYSVGAAASNRLLLDAFKSRPVDELTEPMAAVRKFARCYIAEMTPGTDIADEILRTIRQLIRRVSEHSRYLLQNVGLTMPQFVCLKAIGELENKGVELITVAQIAKDVQLSPATVSRILDRLVRASFVTRIRSEEDRRKVSLSLTASGLERYQALPTPLQERFLTRLDELAHAEQNQLLASLRKVAELMDASDLDAAPLLAPGTDAEPPLPEP